MNRTNTKFLQELFLVSPETGDELFVKDFISYNDGSNILFLSNADEEWKVTFNMEEV